MAELTRYVQQFEEAAEASQDGRAEAEQARDYFDGNQFTDAEKRTLRRRKQPITPENLIKPKVEALCGLERQGRVDPIAYPRTPSKEDAANAATDSLRYVEQDQDLDIKKSKVFENMLVEGYGGVEVAVRQLREGVVDPYVVHIAWDRLYHDPHSRAADFSDDRYRGYITWMDFAEAKEKWPDKEDVLQSTAQRGTSSTFDTFEDKPEFAHWYDTKRKRIRVNTHYHLENGVWHKCVFTLAGELEESAPVPFLDDEGRPENPLILQSAYVDRDNDRYGIVRDMIPLQDEVNKRRSKFLHMVNNNRFRIDTTMGQNKEAVRKELAKPDGIIVGDPQSVEFLDSSSKEMGQFQLLQDTRATLKGNIGPNAYMQGKAGQDQSGRAILAQQQAGMTEMTPLLDNLRHFTLRMYRQIWNRIRQYWTAERWIRVTDNENNVKFVGLNTPPELDPQSAMMGAQRVVMALQAGEIDQPTAEQYVAQIQQKAQIGNNIAELDVDIEIEEVNETPTLQIEQFEQLTQLVSSGVLGSPPPPEVIEMLIQASNLRDKAKLLEIIEQMKEAAAQPNPQMERAQEAQVAGEEAKVQETQSKTMLNVAKAQQTAAQPMIDAFTAGTSSQPGLPPA